MESGRPNMAVVQDKSRADGDFGGRRNGRKWVYFGGSSCVFLNIAVGCGGKHLITDDS